MNQNDYIGTATYDPADNKLRLYAFARLPRELYERIKAAGFQWAPKQELFVAPSWTPEREDLLLELCGDVEDESTTPEDRAEFRAARYEGYLANRERDAARAAAAVEEIASGIPLGQPILVGHHSEKHARRDAEKIRRGMERAVDQWGKAEYWRSRVPAVLAHADRREAPGVRSRRIKGLAADLRKVDARIASIDRTVARWTKIAAGESFLSRKTGDGSKIAATPTECARHLVGYDRESGLEYYKWSEGLDDGTLTADAAAAEAIANLDAMRSRSARWGNHFQNRIAFETAALALEEGRDPDAPAPAEVPYAVGGTVLTRAGGRHRWSGSNDGEPVRRAILRVTRRDGRTISLKLEGLRDAVAVEACASYLPPDEKSAAAARAAVKAPPLCNYPAGSITIHSPYRREPMVLPVEEWTAEEWRKKSADSKGTRLVAATATHGAHRVRSGFSKVGGYSLVAVFIVDQKRTDPPVKAPPPPAPEPTPPKEESAVDDPNEPNQNPADEAPDEVEVHSPLFAADLDETGRIIPGTVREMNPFEDRREDLTASSPATPALDAAQEEMIEAARGEGILDGVEAVNEPDPEKVAAFDAHVEADREDARRTARGEYPEGIPGTERTLDVPANMAHDEVCMHGRECEEETCRRVHAILDERGAPETSRCPKCGHATSYGTSYRDASGQCRQCRAFLPVVVDANTENLKKFFEAPLPELGLTGTAPADSSEGRIPRCASCGLVVPLHDGKCFQCLSPSEQRAYTAGLIDLTNALKLADSSEGLAQHLDEIKAAGLAFYCRHCGYAKRMEMACHIREGGGNCQPQPSDVRAWAAERDDRVPILLAPGEVVRGSGQGPEIDAAFNAALTGTAPADSSDGRDAMRERIAGMAASLKAGVRAVSAPDLFPTPPDVAARMVALAHVGPGMRVLEPSAGTGRLLDALNPGAFLPLLDLKAVEINPDLAQGLRNRTPGLHVLTSDFLAVKYFGSGPFDRILMNPPFSGGADIAHIRHALRFLRPGGVLVGLCANGPRQEREIEPMTDYWEELLPGTFAGTQVRAAMFRIVLGADGKPVPA